MSKTRLTKAMRDEIVENVMSATTLPAERKAIENEESQRAMELRIAAQPTGFNELAAAVPLEWFALESSCCVPRDCLSPRGVFSSNYWGHINYPRAIPVSANDRVRLESGFEDLHTRAVEWLARHKEIENGIRAFVNSVQTVEALLERMPELGPHVPVRPSPNYAVMAPSNLLSQLAGVGFGATPQG